MSWFLLKALHRFGDFWDRSYFSIIRNGTEWRISILATKPPVSLGFQPVFLKSALEEQQEAEKKVFLICLWLKILKKGHPDTMSNALGPASPLSIWTFSLVSPSLLALYCLLLMLHNPELALPVPFGCVVLMPTISKTHFPCAREKN